jgi:hypothetical protein
MIQVFVCLSIELQQLAMDLFTLDLKAHDQDIQKAFEPHSKDNPMKIQQSSVKRSYNLFGALQLSGVE